MKREDVVRLRELLEKATQYPAWGGWPDPQPSRHGTEHFMIGDSAPYIAAVRRQEDAELISAMHRALPALLALAEAVEDAPEGRVYVIGTGDGDDLLTIDPRDRQDRETVRDMAGTRVRLVAAPDGE